MLQGFRMHQSPFPIEHGQIRSPTPNIDLTKAWRTMVVTWQPFLRKRETWKGKIPQLSSVYLSKGVHQLMFGPGLWFFLWSFETVFDVGGEAALFESIPTGLTESTGWFQIGISGQRGSLNDISILAQEALIAAKLAPWKSWQEPMLIYDSEMHARLGESMKGFSVSEEHLSLLETRLDWEQTLRWLIWMDWDLASCARVLQISCASLYRRLRSIRLASGLNPLDSDDAAVIRCALLQRDMTQTDVSSIVSGRVHKT